MAKTVWMEIFKIESKKSQIKTTVIISIPKGLFEGNLLKEVEQLLKVMVHE